MALDSTPGGLASNAFVDYATANAFLTTEWLNVQSWTAASQPVAESALITAAFIMSKGFFWFGAKFIVDQALPSPASGLVDSQGYSVDSNTIPLEVEKANAIFALYLLDKDRLKDPAVLGLGLREIKVGPINLKIDDKMLNELVPLNIRMFLEPFASLRGSAQSGGGSIRVGRA